MSPQQCAFFCLIACAFNLLTGTGYFFFSGVTNFGDWAQVIAGMHPYWLWRMLLIVGGMAAYYEAMRMIAIGLVRYLGVSQSDHARIRRLMWVPHFTAIIIEVVAGLRNPLGIALVFESALPATAGANCAPFSLSTTPRNQPSPVLTINPFSEAMPGSQSRLCLRCSLSWSLVLESRFNVKG